MAGACSVVAGAGPRDLGGFSTQRLEGGTVAAAGIRGEAVPIPDGAGVSGQDNPILFGGTTEGRLQ